MLVRESFGFGGAQVALDAIRPEGSCALPTKVMIFDKSEQK